MRPTGFDHLEAACNLHRIEEVDILEHRHGGAFHKVFQVTTELGDSPEEHELEAACHRKYAELLEDEIDAWARPRKIPLRVRSFLMGLCGDVSLLSDIRSESETPPETKLMLPL